MGPLYKHPKQNATGINFNLGGPNPRFLPSVQERIATCGPGTTVMRLLSLWPPSR